MGRHREKSGCRAAIAHALDDVLRTAAPPMADISGCDVLIVGAGPVGTTLAIDLA
jgi:ribulose 1,5-bisphosphate synthetase/thiazole synthase